MEIKRKLVKVGNDSLMIIIPKSICEGLKLKSGDNLVVDIKKAEGGNKK